MQVQVSQDIALLLTRAAPLIVLESSQESVALQLLTKQASATGQTLYRWSLTEGIESLGFSPRVAKAQQHTEPKALLQSIRERNQGGIFVLCDFHPFWENDPLIVRLLKDILLDFDNLPKRIVLLSHSLSLPPELRSFAAYARLTLPNDDEILSIVRGEARKHVERNPAIERVKTDGRALQQLVASLRGLTQRDVARLAQHAIVDDGAITANDIAEINSAKFALLNQQGLLSYEYDTEDFARVGGLPNFKNWLAQRREVFVGAQQGQQSIDSPKGVLLLGVQGAGKSLAARAIAGLWQLPLLRLDMGSLYNKFIGETEKNLRDALAQAEKMSPCVLWLDELEKAMASSDSDDGVSQRLLGYLLTWMAERKSPVFMVATSNNIRQLPAELVRKGRFDEIFFVDLPELSVREEIFEIHLRKRDQDTSEIQLSRLAEASDGFSGAEIEQVVVAALYTCQQGQGLTTEQLLHAIYQTSPLSVVMSEQIEGLRQWASTRAVPA